MNGEYDFDSLEQARFPFKYRDKHYVCIEAFAAGAAKFRDYNLNAGRYEYFKNDAGEEAMRLVGHTDLNQGETLLVSECCWRCNMDGVLLTAEDRVPKEHVTWEEVKGWEGRVVSRLYDWIREHSDLGDDTVDGLEKQLASLQRRLERLRKAQQGSLSKNGHTATPLASASPTS